MRYEAIVILGLISSVLGEQEIEVMKSITEHIGNVVFECQGEMKFDGSMIKEFLAFWNTHHELNDTHQGCVLACVFKRLELHQRGGSLARDNFEAFLKANGADVEISSKLIDLYQLCSLAAVTKKSVREHRNGCVFALEIAKCFRYGIFQMHWAPAYEQNDEDERNDMIEAMPAEY